MLETLDLPTIVLAVGSLGTAAYGVADASNWQQAWAAGFVSTRFE